MYIHEAIKAAMSNGLAITRPEMEESAWCAIAIVPTNTSDCCFIACADVEKAKRMGIHIGRRWNPLAEDLLANDWEVTDYVKSADLVGIIR